MTHYGIPWPLFRSGVRLLRRTFFTVDPSDQPALRYAGSLDDLRRILGAAHFTNAWELSYHYSGEDLNMRRPEYDDSDARPWKQTHVRGFVEPDGVRLLAHYEYEPTQYPDAHLHNERLSVDRGLDIVADVLTDAGVAFKVEL